MRLMLALALPALLCGPVIGAECTLYNARYIQDNSPWVLTFKRVPQFAAPNQTAAFYLELPTSGVELDGGVSVPNGFGSPLWSVSGACGPEGNGICTFPNDGESPSIYGEYDWKLQFLDIERGSKAPEQLLLPGLAVNLWYSNYRNEEWIDEVNPGDAFILEGCD